MSVNSELGIDDVYIVHGITGYEEREQFLNNHLRNLNFDFQFVTESLDKTQNELWIRQYFISDIRDVLTNGPLFCTLVHILCYEMIVKANKPYAIIFENDVCFLGDFSRDIRNIIKEADSLDEGFIVSLENSTLKFPSLRETKKSRHLYPAKMGRCAAAYLVDQQAVKNMLNRLKVIKCDKVIDWWHNDLINEGVIRMYWAHPPLIEQGSFNGKYTSSIASRSDGRIRSFRWRFQKFYKRYVHRLFKS
ncbi:glycosyltransferase family 25 protein [Desertivirga xinjiangensis]|uniref:glycosyltransferase family 25 protein n=1 Tax=Desertivirga xinjiangensis TaxID=539206 RepID=UPI00210C4E1D|nr:glycosyltransferase family 25 protein [Pedobacter xinjiangensis]